MMGAGVFTRAIAAGAIATVMAARNLLPLLHG